ncbi:flippase [Bernardetia sp.]|uniref:flippase n=1 Tax=Bernardetia sp. TaxID=1937974 RepID=UPI0025C0A5BC|nr:flippase [Bernardetia sp.]
MSNEKTKFLGFDKKGLQKYGSNTIWLLVEKAIRFATGIWIFPLTANYLGAAQYGKLEYAIGFVFLVTPLASLGIISILTRQLVADKENHLFYFGSAFYLRVVAAIFIILFLNIIGVITPSSIEEILPFALPSDTTERWLIFILSLNLFFNVSDLVTSHFQVQVRSHFIVKVQIVVILISAVLKLFGIWKEYSVIFFGSILLIETILTAIGLFLMYFKTGENIKHWKWDTAIAKVMLRDATPLIFSGIAVSIYMRIDQIMIKQFLGDAASGHYGAAVRISEMWYFVPVVFAGSLFPAIVELQKNNPEKYKKRMQQFFDFLLWASIAIALPITFLSEWIIIDVLPYGKEFSPSVSVLSVHVWAGVFVATGVAGSRWMLAENKQIFNFLQTSLGAIINFALNWYWLPQYGLLGAAYATVASYAIASFGCSFFLPQIFPLLKMHVLGVLAPFRYLIILIRTILK